MKELIEFMVKALVDDPSEVNITEITGDKITLYDFVFPKTILVRLSASAGVPPAPSAPSSMPLAPRRERERN